MEEKLRNDRQTLYGQYVLKMRGRCSYEKHDQEGNRLGNVSHERNNKKVGTLHSYRRWKCVRINKTIIVVMGN
jgi:hypothetical protein